MKHETATPDAIASRYTPERWDAEALDRLAALYAEDMVFQDPLQRVSGRDAFRKVMERLVERSRELRFDVREAQESGDTVWMTWTCLFAPKPLGPVLTLDGSSRIVRRDGLIVDHRDWWDALGPMIGAIPGARMLRAAVVKALTFA